MLSEKIGQGALGEVWRAHHDRFGEVAFKFLQPGRSVLVDDDLERRFAVEAVVGQRVDHPHAVKIYEAGKTSDGLPFVVMELLHGKTLDELLTERGGTLEIGETIRMLQQVGAALDAVHAHQVVHRDVKPHNIFVCLDENVPRFKLIDFGSGKQLDAKEAAQVGGRPTDPNVVVGTPAYLSPEMVTEPSGVDGMADLWSLTVTAYRCLTGTLPFPGQKLADVCSAILGGRLQRPTRANPTLPAVLDTWFAKAFVHDKSKRPRTGEELAESFAEELGESEATTVLRRGDIPAFPPRPAAAQRPSTSPPRRWPMIVAGLVPLALGASVAWLLFGGGGDGDTPARDASALASAPGSASARPSAPPAPAPSGVGATSASAERPAPPVPAPSSLPAGGEGGGGGGGEGAASAPAGDDVDDGPVASAPVLRAFDQQRVLVPAGPAILGCMEGDLDCAADEPKAREVDVPAFRIDLFEVSAQQYAICVRKGGCTDDGLRGFQLGDGPFTISPRCSWGQPLRLNHPINCVTYGQAERYCHWAGGRLPRPEEWEKAARGSKGRIFPWGDVTATCERAVMAQGRQGCRAEGTWPVGAKLAGASPYGIFDMAGNVREWVAAAYGQEGLRMTRGGSWSNGVAKFLRASAVDGLTPDSRSIHTGFRCVSDVDGG